MKNYELISSNGIIEIGKYVSATYNKNKIYNYIYKNGYEKAAPGVYVSPDTIIDKLMVFHKRCPCGVVSHDEALYFYGLIDREPLQPTATVYSGYNTSKLTKSGYKVYYFKKELLNLGETNVIDNYGNAIKMYDMERTIVDMIRNRSQFEIQDFNSALKSYVLSPKKDLNKLALYAEKFNVRKVLKIYLEVLL